MNEILNEDNERNNCELKFIWGIKSSDGFKCDANLYTTNDIDICYDRKTKLYMLGIETAYTFKNKYDEVQYLQELLDYFTEFMEHNNYNTNEPYDFWMCEPVILIESDSISELYTHFKIFVEGYKALYGNKME